MDRIICQEHRAFGIQIIPCTYVHNSIIAVVNYMQDLGHVSVLYFPSSENAQYMIQISLNCLFVIQT